MAQAEPVAVKADQASSILKMKTGDYMIHVFVMIGKNFKNEDDVTINPLIEVSTCGITKYTSAKENVACMSSKNESWREHLFFEPRSVHSSKIEIDTITIKVKNKGLLKDQLIGMYEFDMARVYSEKKHTIQNQWIALFNPESSNFSEITGNLKLSISVMGPGDEQVQLSENDSLEDPNQLVMMPAQIKKEYKQLKIRFITAYDLPKMDRFGTIDAFIQTTFMGKTMKTKPVTAKDNKVAIEQEFWLPVQWPMATDRLILQVFDHDSVGSNEIVGSMFFSVKKLIEHGKQPGGMFFWQNIYGSPVDYKDETAVMMNNNPELGSTWKGKILMHIESEDSKHPERRDDGQILEPIIKETANNKKLYAKNQYEVIAEFGMGICLPLNSLKYKLKVQIGEFVIASSDPKEAKEGYNRWSERIQKPMLTEYQSIEEIDKIYVYLLHGELPICYWTGKLSEFTDPNPKFRWLTMKVDKSIGKVDKDYEAGMIQFKMSIHDTRNAAINYKLFDAWKSPPPRRLESRKIRCFIFQCRDIPSADADGCSDAFISLWNPDNKKEVKTRVIEDSLNPIYFETLELLYDMADIETAPPIVMNIWDQDTGMITNSADFLGRCTVPLDKAASNLKSLTLDEKARNNEIPRPQWQDIKMGFDDSLPAQGQVLCSFAIVADDYDFETPTKYLRLQEKIPTKEYTLEINILGLRELESCGFIPVKKPYIRFRVKSLLPPEKAQAVTNIDTDPNAPGPNPNINTTLTFSVQLPTEDLYCPGLGCDVFDYVFSGLSQPLIGTMNIMIGDIKSRYEEEQRTTRKKMEEIIAQLEKFLGMNKAALQSHIRESQSEPVSRPTRPGLPRDDILMQVGRLDGYAQLKDPENMLVFDEEAPLVNQNNIEEEEYDFAQFQPEYRDKLRQYSKIQEDYVKQLNDIQKKGGENKTDIAKKTELKRQLLQSRSDFIEQKKLAMSVKKAKDHEIFMQEMGDLAHQMVICPQYKYNEELKIYTECSVPPETVYKAVGFNNLEVVRKMMDGDDADKRSGFQGYQQRMSIRKQAQYDQDGNDPLDSARNSARLAEKEQRAQDNDRHLKASNKHYRKFYEDELEKNKEIFHDNVFTTVPIYRGQSRGLKTSWFKIFRSQQVDESGEITDKKQVGYFKGRISCYNEEEAKAFKEEKREKMDRIFRLISQIHKTLYGQPLDVTIPELVSSHEQQKKFATKLQDMHLLEKDNNLLEFLKDSYYKEIIQKQLLTQTAAQIQLYILEGFHFAQRDVGSFSDPYLVVRYGDEVTSLRDKYLLDEQDPTFNKYFEFKGTFPGASPLVIEAWDYDDLFGDDLIGRSVIDLDDRFFSQDWQALDEKPIEYRDLYHPSTTLSQGVITCWLEIQEQDKKRAEKTSAQKVWDIQSEPELDYQIRVSILDTKNVPLEDIEGTSDVFMKCYIDDHDKKQTDTHYRCQNGEASFNYRLMFDVKAPRKKDKDPYQLVVQAWDFDLFKSNDYICEWVLDLTEIVKNVRLTQQPAHLTKKYWMMLLKDKMRDVKPEFMEDDSFWLTLDKPGKDGKSPKVRLDIRVLPGALAEKKKLGEGRTEPNMEPHLPPPIGRIQFSLNPITMLAQLVNKEYLNKLYAIICVLVCVACLIAMAPMILSNFASMIMAKMIGLQ